MSQILGAGTVAPDFTLRVTPDQGSRCAICGQTGHPRLLPRRLESRLRRPDGALQRDLPRVPASTAPSSSASRWTAPGATRRSRKDRKLHFPLLADFEPKGAVAQTLRRVSRRRGVSERALFVIDAEGRDSLELLSRRSA